MKVTEHLKKAKETLFSYEILPPLKGASIQTIYDTLDALVEFKPPFIDVTYHREEYVYKTKQDGLLEKQSVRKRPGKTIESIHEEKKPLNAVDVRKDLTP